MALSKAYSLTLSLLLLQSASCQISESVDEVSEDSQKNLSIHIPKEVRDGEMQEANVTIKIEESDGSDIESGSGVTPLDDNKIEGKIYFSIFHPNQVPRKVHVWSVKISEKAVNKNICFKDIDSASPIRVSIFSDSPKKKKVIVTIANGRNGVCKTLENSTGSIDYDGYKDEESDDDDDEDNIGLIVAVILLSLVVLILGGREAYRSYDNYMINKRIEGDEEQRKSKPIFTGKKFPLKVDAEKGGTSNLMETKPLEKDQDQETIKTEEEEFKGVKLEIKGEEENEETEEIEMNNQKPKKYGHLGSDFPGDFHSKHVQKKF